MQQEQLSYFEDLKNVCRNAVVLLDVDGTLTPDGAREIPDSVLRAVAELAQENEVYLCSNKRGPKAASRLAELSRMTGLNTTDPAHRKPSPRVLDGIDLRARPIVVIGDRVLTDGICAYRIGGRFVRVRRKRAAGDPLRMRALYFLDDMLTAILSA